MSRKTVFDNVFRTICERMPHLLIPLINEAFDTHYPDTSEITQLRNEHFVRDGEIITDPLIAVGSHTYHIECQSRDESNMVIRMAEYDFAIALEGTQPDGSGNFIMNIPESCVVYLRDTSSVSRNAHVTIRFPDGTSVLYKMKTICVQDYSQDEIFQKKLLMFLPFYVLRYEKNLPSARKADAERLSAMVEEFNQIFDRLDKECCQNKPDDYVDLYNAAIRIIRHVVKSSVIKRRFMDMGGKVLPLLSEQLREEGRVAGIKEGITKLYYMVYVMVQDGDITPEKGAQRLEISVDELRSRMEVTGYKFPG